VEHEGDLEQKIVLTDENGNEYEYRLSEVLEVQGRTYAVLLPVGDVLESEGVIFRLEEDESGTVAFHPVEDDAEWQAVEEAYHRLLFEEEDED
jgi:uncharacterized protein YrzB (UPF0473 family)